MISIRCHDPRKLAELLITNDFISNVNFHQDGRKVTFNTGKRDQFFDLLNHIIVEHQIDVTEITSPDDNLQAVFDYLVGR